MNSLPLATPFSVPGLNTADSNTPPGFLHFLRSLIHDYLSDEPPRIPSANKDAWVSAVDGLTGTLFGSFPLPDSTSWNSMEEKILALQQRKRAIIKATLGGEESLADNLTWEEIQGLFE